MPKRLCGLSFHSVKGGVGKSTLATLAALAKARSGARVWLIDMDLTGTSLSDVLPLCAPELPKGEDEVLNLRADPTGFLDRFQTLARVEARSEDHLPEGRWDFDERTLGLPRPFGVPYLNDYLLHATPHWEEELDARPAVMSWRWPEAGDTLGVLPSSALPRDVERMLPVIFDEEHSAYLEARFERLLAALLDEVEDGDELWVVIDTPPTIPGLSRAVLGVALRMASVEKLPLAQDGEIPPALAVSEVGWRAALVASADLQDLRAADRWLSRLLPEEQAVVRPVLNLMPPDIQQDDRVEFLRRHLGGGAEPSPLAPEGFPGLVDPEAPSLVSAALGGAPWVVRDPALQRFSGVAVDQAPLQILNELIDALWGSP